MAEKIDIHDRLRAETGAVLVTGGNRPGREPGITVSGAAASGSGLRIAGAGAEAKSNDTEGVGSVNAVAMAAGVANVDVADFGVSATDIEAASACAEYAGTGTAGAVGIDRADTGEVGSVVTQAGEVEVGAANTGSGVTNACVIDVDAADAGAANTVAASVGAANTRAADADAKGEAAGNMVAGVAGLVDAGDAEDVGAAKTGSGVTEAGVTDIDAADACLFATGAVGPDNSGTGATRVGAANAGAAGSGVTNTGDAAVGASAAGMGDDARAVGYSPAISAADEDFGAGATRSRRGAADDAIAGVGGQAEVLPKTSPSFVHLHVHSAFSLLEGALPLDRLVEMAAADGQPALAVTDRNNLFGALEFSQKAAAKGLQPIMGAKLSVDHGMGEFADSGRKGHGEDLPCLVLLAMNRTGYANLVKLASIAHLGNGDYPGRNGSDTASDGNHAADIGGNPEDHSNHPVGSGSNTAGHGNHRSGDDNGEGRQTLKQPLGQSVDPALALSSAPSVAPSLATSSGQIRGPSAELGPHVTLNDLKRFGDGLICLTAAGEGIVNRLLRIGDGDGARAALEELSGVFTGRLYVEIQRHGSRDDPREQTVENPLLALAYSLDLPIVATNAAYFASRDDYESHDALMCIAQGVVIADGDRQSLTPEHYFKSRAEMAALFTDLPEALENTVEIARRCSWRANTRDPILPRFAAGKGEEDALEAEAQLLRKEANEGLKERLEKFELAQGFSRKDYEDRLDFELDVIEKMGFPGYFLIVADFIKWAKAQSIPVGPGRGSGASSLVAWALTITDIDPMRFTLLFERFLNPERISMPDFDIDFCQDRREEVIRYVQEKYGFDQVAQIITFGTLQARAVLRDAGRVLQMSYGHVDRIAKLVPNNPANPLTLIEALESEPRLREARASEPVTTKLFDIATRLEGLYRHASTHAAGIVIGDRKLDELVPLYRDPRSDMPVTQFSMKWVEPAGLVKFDFLGLKTLTVLDMAVKLVRRRGEAIDLDTIPLDDPDTYDMLTRGETVGVFQLESAGMRKALIGMKPDRFEDIIALVALYRPGPMENIPVYNARKHGEEKILSIHKKIDHLVAETQGVIVYQEQVVQIARELAGYSLGEADVLRRAMGKKIRSEMNEQREVFVSGATERGLTKTKANEIFDLLAKFADYGFNKAHAAAYALVSYQTAYMKARYPVEFLAASMQLERGNTDKLAVFRQEAKDQGIELVAPSVATSDAGFAVRNGRIYYALAALKGVGEGAVAQIVADREANGPFNGLSDFFARIDIRQTNRRTIESLIAAGALDCFGYPREQLLGGIERLMGHAARIADDIATGQNDMFGGAGQADEIRLAAVEPWHAAEKLQREFQTMGFYLSAHPLDEYHELMEKLRIQRFADFAESVRGGATAGRLAGTVISRQERKTRTGKRMGIVMLSDPSGQYEAICFEETLAQNRDLLEPGQPVILLVGAEMREDGVSIRIQDVESLEDEAGRKPHNLRIYLRDEKPVANISAMLKGDSAPKGEDRISMVVIQSNGAREVEVMLRETFKMSPRIASAIKAVPGVEHVELV